MGIILVPGEQEVTSDGGSGRVIRSTGLVGVTVFLPMVVSSTLNTMPVCFLHQRSDPGNPPAQCNYPIKFFLFRIGVRTVIATAHCGFNMLKEVQTFIVPQPYSTQRELT
ncbi:hypothetical protein B4900_15200 [Yersinia rohdei]|nr:hypothetical protein B4900_15200 [Yersinia rohdei]